MNQETNKSAARQRAEEMLQYLGSIVSSDVATLGFKVIDGTAGNALIIGPAPSIMINVPEQESEPVAFLVDVISDAGATLSFYESLRDKYGDRIRYGGVFAVVDGKIVTDQDFVMNNKVELMKRFVAGILVQQAMGQRSTSEKKGSGILLPSDKIIVPGKGL